MFTVSHVTQKDERLTRVYVKHHAFDHFFALYFNENRTLVQRDMFIALDASGPQFYERHRFERFEDVIDADGERIPFPRRAIYQFVLGNTPSGDVVEYMRHVIDVLKIGFNHNIPDERFHAELPAGAQIYDRITGKGWVDKSVEARTQSRRKQTLIVIALNLALICGGVLYFLVRRRSQSLP